MITDSDRIDFLSRMPLMQYIKISNGDITEHEVKPMTPRMYRQAVDRAIAANSSAIVWFSLFEKATVDFMRERIHRGMRNGR